MWAGLFCFFGWRMLRSQVANRADSHTHSHIFGLIEKPTHCAVVGHIQIHYHLFWVDVTDAPSDARRWAECFRGVRTRLRITYLMPTIKMRIPRQPHVLCVCVWWIYWNMYVTTSVLSCILGWRRPAAMRSGYRFRFRRNQNRCACRWRACSLACRA